MDVLGISEVTSDEEVAYDYGGHDRRIYAKDVSLFGEKADVQLLFTQSNPANDASVGLCEVTYFFSNDADMHSIQNQISRMYGEGSQDKPDDYAIDKEGLIFRQPANQSGTLNVPQQDGTMRTYLLNPSEHKTYWAKRGKNLLSEDIAVNAVNYFIERGATPESADQLIDKMTLVSLVWSDGNVLEDKTIEPNNRVRFDGRGLVYVLQMGGKKVA